MKVFWIMYEIALIAFECWFCIQTHAARKNFYSVKKEYLMSPEVVKPGHSGRPRCEIEPELSAARFTYVTFVIISAACLFACVDCLNWIFE